MYRVPRVANAFALSSTTENHFQMSYFCVFLAKNYYNEVPPRACLALRIAVLKLLSLAQLLLAILQNDRNCDSFHRESDREYPEARQGPPTVLLSFLEQVLNS